MFGKKKHKAKEARYWPISLTETKLRSIKLYAKKNESNNQAKKRTFSCGKSRGQDWHILTTQVANQNAGFASSCPLVDSAIQ